MPSKIEDYAIIGDTKTVALVDLTGSIVWWCATRFDSGAASRRYSANRATDGG